MILAHDAWLLILGMSLSAAFFILCALSRARLAAAAPALAWKSLRWLGLAGAALLAAFAACRVDAVMFCALGFFVAMLCIPAGEDDPPRQDREDRTGQDNS